MVPAQVPARWAKKSTLSVQMPEGALRTVRILLDWRKDAPEPKVSAPAGLLRKTRSQWPRTPA
jgi:hypothetical protein